MKIIDKVNKLTSFEKIDLAEEGISKNSLEEFQKQIGLDQETIAELLSVSKKDLLKKKEEDKFDLTTSEKIVALAEVYSYGYKVFEDTGKFNHWISRPSSALGGIVPLKLLKTRYGIIEVMRLIGRIDYGIYS